jgi:polar amino acid transport system substrate-binding protein
VTPVGTELNEKKQSLDTRVEDLVRAGRVRVAMLPPQYSKDPVTGELRGWAVDLARAFGARLGIEARPVEYPGPDKVLEGLAVDACDVGFLPNSPSWTNAADFSDAFLQLDFTYLVPVGSSIRSSVDADRPGIRIAIVSHHASTLALLRILKHAKPVSAETLDSAFDLLCNGHADAFASTRPQLLDDSVRLPGSAVLEDRYGVNFLALVVPKGRAGRLSYVNEFVQEAKASGLVQRAIERAAWRGVRVVSP